jgi:hypothetical protein
MVGMWNWMRRLIGWAGTTFTWFFTPMQAWTAFAGVAAVVIAFLQGMTLAGAVLFAAIIMAAVAVVGHYGLAIRDRVRAPPPKQRLQEIYAATQHFHEMLMSTRNAANVLQLYAIFDKWTIAVSAWLGANLGPGARGRYRALSVPSKGTWIEWRHMKVPEAENRPEVEDAFNQMSIALQQQMQSLRELIEKETWDPTAKLKGLPVDAEKEFEELLREVLK